MPLSLRAKEAIKVALAVTIAMAIALWMGWERPYWAAFGVIMISLATEGQSLNKGAMRLLGTLVAAAVALSFLALFPQERWWFMALVSVYVGFCSYMMMGPKLSYFWYASGFICVVIAVNSSNSLTAFQIAVERTQETGTGVLVYSLITSLLWPQTSRGALEDATRKLFAVQVQLYRAYRDLVSGMGKPEDSRPLRIEELRLLKQVEETLNAAETDSYEVWEARRSWRVFHTQSTALMESLEKWRMSLPEVEPLDLRRLLPALDALHAELDLRFGQIERMLDGQAPDRMPEAAVLDVDKAEIQALTTFQKAAISVTKGHLERLETLSRSLFECVRDLRDFGGPPTEAMQDATSHRPLTLDQDRLLGVVSVLATLWIAFLIWVYVDPPGHASFVMLSTVYVMVIVRSGAPALDMAFWQAIGALLGGIPHFFIMPHLSGYGELGLMIFGTTFAIGYLLSEPRHMAPKMGLLVNFVQVISVQNQQTYDFQSYVDSLSLTVLVGALIVATCYFPQSSRPEKAFLRLIRRFFRQAGYLMSELAPEGQLERGVFDRCKGAFYRNDLLQLPHKLAGLAQRIDYRSLPDTTPEQVQDLVSGLFVFAFRLKDLVEAHESDPAKVANRHLMDDLGAWRLFIQGRLQHRAVHPDLPSKPTREARDQLAAHLSRLEARVNKALAGTGASELSIEDLEQFYRLLGSYRGLSEAMLGYAPLANGINWARWREARF